MGKLVMGYWDCPYCDKKEIRGDAAVCPACGRPRGQVRFYMKGQAQNQERREDDVADIEYVDEEKAKYVNRNPDWYCSFCETLNSDSADTCRSCGASRADSEANYFQMHENRERREAARQQQAQPAKAAPKKSSRLPMILIAAALVIVGLVMYFNSNTTENHYQISGVSWERAIRIEQNQLFHESGWSVPSGGTTTSQRSEIHHYDSVLDHYEDYEVERSRRVIDYYETYYTYEDLGNGLFNQVEHERPVYKTEYYTETERRPVYVQVPRYQTKYYYDIWRWVESRTAAASGEGHSPYWPDPQLGEDEREGTRTEAYRVTITDTSSSTAARYRVAEADWNTLSVGDTVYITAKRSGADPCISDEKGNPLIQLMNDR